MAAARKKKKKKAATPPSSGKSIGIRMYDVGFGDCFLVTIPTDEGNRRLLFDCGSIAKGSRSMSDVVSMVIADLPDKRIDVVVCTHRHRDHVAGFDRADWKNVEVGEVWMPWTEDPDDPEATRIREAQTRLATALNADVERRLAARGLSASERSALEAWQSVSLNALSNEAAMDMLHGGFKGGSKIPRRFLPERDESKKTIETFETEHLPGVTINVLGPSFDEKVIRDMDPPAGKSYRELAASADSERDGGDAPEPFNADFSGHRSGFILEPDEKKRIQDFSDGAWTGAAAALDSAVNGTSLMLLLQVGDVHLLFPGDAQWGTWNAALSNPRWDRLLKKVRFYKIGHHGSHNATPVDFVEKVIGKDVIGMASTRPMSNWPHIPLPELMTKLAEHGPIVRSDQPELGEAKTFIVSDGVIETLVPL